MPDIPFTLPNGIRGNLAEDGKISILGKAPTEDQKPSALSGPGAVDPDEPTPLAKPTGRVVRPNFNTGLTQPAESIQAPDEPGLKREDPIGQAVTTAAIAGPAAQAAAKIGGAIGTAVEGASIAGIPTAVAAGDPREAARDALAGAVISPVLHALPDLPGAIGDRAKALNRQRIPTAVTGGAGGAAARKVIAAGDILKQTAEAHPELQEALLTGSDEAKRAAIENKASELTKLQDADIDQIAKHHPEAVGGRVPIAEPLSRLGLLVHEAHKAGDDELEDAAKSAVESLRRFDEGGTISPEQLRTQRNSLARKIASRAERGTPAFEKATRDAQTVKAAFNQAIEKLADETSGVDAAAHMMRNREIASLLPAQDFLEQQAEAVRAQPVRGPIGKLVDLAGKVDVAHPLANITKPALALADKAIPAIDVRLARLAGPAGPAGAAALKRVVLSPTRETIQEAIRTGVPAQIALQVARLGQPQGAQ